MRYAIKVIRANGEEELPNWEAAEQQREFLERGFDEGEIQGVFVVQAPEDRIGVRRVEGPAYP